MKLTKSGNPKKSGGPGKGQGRKPKEPTKVLYKRVPERLYEECKAAVESVLKQ